MSQPHEALAIANRIRMDRAAWKRETAAATSAEARRRVIAALDETPCELGRARVREILLSQHGWGPGRVRNLTVRAGVGENRTLESLTERERERLSAMLDGRPVPLRAAPLRFRALEASA